jgi:polyisoprenoid-binding protein YceI
MPLRHLAPVALLAALPAVALTLDHELPLPAAHAAAVLAPVTFTVDGAHSQVLFKVRHLGVSTVTGRFSKFTGSFQYDPQTQQGGSVNFTIDATSISTDNERRDAHLRSPDFFETEKFPQIAFTSTKVERTAAGKYRIAGNLTMHGVTKPVVLDGEMLGPQKSGQNWVAGINATGKLSRKEFGLVWDRVTEGVSAVGDEITMQIEIEAKAPMQ